MKLKRVFDRCPYGVLHGAATAGPVAAVWSVIILAGALSGCAAVTTAEGERLRLTSDQFAAYAERVFRDQNRVATDLAFALEDAPSDSAAIDDLESAEATLLDACAGLNEVAAARRDDGNLGAGRQISAARQTPGCERAVMQAAAVLDRVL